MLVHAGTCIHFTEGSRALSELRAVGLSASIRLTHPARSCVTNGHELLNVGGRSRSHGADLTQRADFALDADDLLTELLGESVSALGIGADLEISALGAETVSAFLDEGLEQIFVFHFFFISERFDECGSSLLSFDLLEVSFDSCKFFRSLGGFSFEGLVFGGHGFVLGDNLIDGLFNDLEAHLLSRSNLGLLDRFDFFRHSSFLLLGFGFDAVEFVQHRLESLTVVSLKSVTLLEVLLDQLLVNLEGFETFSQQGLGFSTRQSCITQDQLELSNVEFPVSVLHCRNQCRSVSGDGH